MDSPTNKYNEAIADLGLQTFLKMLLVDNFIRKFSRNSLSKLILKAHFSEHFNQLADQEYVVNALLTQYNFLKFILVHVIHVVQA